jgi:hypothetical protein
MKSKHPNSSFPGKSLPSPCHPEERSFDYLHPALFKESRRRGRRRQREVGNPGSSGRDLQWARSNRSSMEALPLPVFLLVDDYSGS